MFMGSSISRSRTITSRARLAGSQHGLATQYSGAGLGYLQEQDRLHQRVSVYTYVWNDLWSKQNDAHVARGMSSTGP